MQTSDGLLLLNILVAFLGVGFVAFTLFEWWRLRGLRKDMEGLEQRTLDALHRSLKATHRVIASYQISDPKQRIALLESAVREDAQVFNAFNSIGYAWMDIGDTAKAIDAFSQAVFRHPGDKAGYCDLAFAHLQAGHDDLSVKYLRQAIEKDASAHGDILCDQRFERVTTRLT